MLITATLLAFLGGFVIGAGTLFGMYASGTLDDFVTSLADSRQEAASSTDDRESSSDSGPANRRDSPAEPTAQSPRDRDSSSPSSGREQPSEPAADGGGLASRSSTGRDVEHWIEGLNQSVEKKTYRVDDDPLMVGRHPDNAIQVQKGEISRRHCRIRQLRPGGDDSKVVVEPMGSDKETRVNGELIDKQTTLYDDDIVEIGPVLLAYRKNASFDVDHSREASQEGIAMEARTAAVKLESWRDRIERALQKHGGDFRKTADALEMDAQQLRELVSKFDFGPD